MGVRLHHLSLLGAVALLVGSPVALWAQDKLGKSAVRTGAVPEWVERLEWQLPANTPRGTAAQIILSDQQSLLAANGGDYYFHQVVKLLTQQAVTTFSQQTNAVSPEFEDVVWHQLTLHRDGKVEDRLATTEFRKLQREPGLEAQILTGELTYAAVLSDIRVGDVLETAYTLHYSNPLLGGHTNSRHHLGSPYPIVRERVVVHVPTALGPAVAGFLVPEGTSGLPDDLYRHSKLRLALQETSTGERKSFSWEGTELPAVEFDEGLPGRAYPYWPMFQVSTFMSWADVVQWAMPLFEVTSLPPDVAKLVETWKQEDEAQRLDRAVHWVEDDVRYFALDLGQHTLKPRPLSDVCSTRFGDCKDKAVLLVSLLRALGLEAWPALTNTYWRDRLHELHPSPRVFNHAVVAYRYRGKLRWVDPTMTKQGGMPGDWAMPPHRAALIIRPQENALSTIDSEMGEAADTEVTDHISVDASTGEATLTSQVKMAGLIADYYRPSLWTLSPAERSKGWFNFIALFYRGLREVKEPVFEDDPLHNTIVLRAEYKIPGFVGRDNDRTYVNVYGYLLRSLIDPNVSRRRHWPLVLPSDRHVCHRIEVDLPFSLETGELPEVIRNRGLNYTIQRGIAGSRLVVQHDLTITRDFVSAEQIDQFCDNLQEVVGSLSTVAFKANSAGASEPPRSSASSTPSTAATSRNP